MQPFRSDEMATLQTRRHRPAQAGRALTQGKIFDRNRLIFGCERDS
ncbi:hypothetical protein ABFA25_14200 [Mycobacterium lepromatosis]|nr:hypothetical protein [Mycobacterium lepromatosis]